MLCSKICGLWDHTYQSRMKCLLSHWWCNYTCLTNTPYEILLWYKEQKCAKDMKRKVTGCNKWFMFICKTLLMVSKTGTGRFPWQNKFVPQSPPRCFSGQPAGIGRRPSAEPGLFWNVKSRTPMNGKSLRTPSCIGISVKISCSCSLEM